MSTNIKILSSSREIASDSESEPDLSLPRGSGAHPHLSAPRESVTAGEVQIHPADSKNPNVIAEEVESQNPDSGHDLEGLKPHRIRHWKSPLVMLIFYAIGVGMSIAHCVFYPGLDGKIVADAYNQERNIRQAASLSLMKSRLSTERLLLLRAIFLTDLFLSQVRHCLCLSRPDSPFRECMVKLYAVDLAIFEADGGQHSLCELGTRCGFQCPFFAKSRNALEIQNWVRYGPVGVVNEASTMV
jgi:hypothetical protein